MGRKAASTRSSKGPARSSIGCSSRLARTSCLLDSSAVAPGNERRRCPDACYPWHGRPLLEFCILSFACFAVQFFRKSWNGDRSRRSTPRLINSGGVNGNRRERRQRRRLLCRKPKVVIVVLRINVLTTFNQTSVIMISKDRPRAQRELFSCIYSPVS